MIKFTPQKFIKFIIIYIINVKWISEFFHLPIMLDKLSIVFMFILIVWLFPDIIKRIFQKDWILFWIGLYTFGVLGGWIINGLNLIHVIWNITNTYFYFLFFIICCIKLKKKDVINILEILCEFQILNCLFSIYEYIYLGCRNDYLGGIFGTLTGCNGYTFIYGVVICAYLLSLYYAKEETIRLILNMISFMVIAAFADIIGLLFALVICLIITIINMHMNIRKFSLIVLGSLFVVLAVIAFKTDYAGRFEYFTNFHNLLKYIGAGSDSSGGIYGVSRVNPFSQINEYFFKNNIFRYLFGFGFGNCAFSNGQRILQSQIFLDNSSFAYYWFSHAYTYMESGILGILSYIIFFACNILHGMKLKRTRQISKWGLFGIIISISGVIAFFYNQSLMCPPGYLMYFAFAIPYIMENKEEQSISIKSPGVC